MTCNSSIIKSLNVYLPDQNAEEISLIVFIKACNEIRRFLGIFGRALHPVKYLTASCTQQLYSKLKGLGTDKKQVIRIILHNVSNEDESICETFQRLLRCISFTAEVMEELADPSSGEEDMKDWIEEVYKRHLEPIQSPVVARLFYLCLRVCPGKTNILLRLKDENESDNDMRASILKAATRITKAVQDLRAISDQWTFTDTFF